MSRVASRQVIESVGRERSDGWELPGRVHVVCVGNELARDDGVGIRVGELLGRLGLPEQITLNFFPELGIGLIDLLTADAKVVVVDALATGGAAGTWRILSGCEVASHSARPVACHTFGIAELLAIAEARSGRHCVEDVALVGIEVADIEGFSTRLSEAVHAALPGVLEAVMRLLDAPEAVIAEARALAESTPREMPLRTLQNERG